MISLQKREVGILAQVEVRDDGTCWRRSVDEGEQFDSGWERWADMEALWSQRSLPALTRALADIGYAAPTEEILPVEVVWEVFQQHRVIEHTHVRARSEDEAIALARARGHEYWSGFVDEQVNEWAEIEIREVEDDDLTT